MNLILKIFTIISILALSLLAENNKTVQIGVFINDIYNFKLNEDRFNVDFYVWYKWMDSSYKPYETIELDNGDILSKTIIDEKYINKIHYVCQRIKAQIRQDFNGTNYPLDGHSLKIILEDSLDTNDSLKIIPDIASTNISLNTQIPGYVTKSYTLMSNVVSYESNFGLPSLNSNHSIYNRLILTIDVARDNFAAFMRTFWAYFIAIFVALVALILRPDNTARFSLAVGAIFAAATNNIIIRSNVPEESTLTLADKIGSLTLGFIFLVVFASAISYRLYISGKHRVVNILDGSLLAILAFSYIWFIIYFTTSA